MIEQRGVVIIPAYGHPEMTAAVLSDCLRERELVDVIVVDNGGDATVPVDARGSVTVIRPRRNLGWLGGTNEGLRAALEGDWTWVVSLNNDTRLSQNFYAGLASALAGNPQRLVAPCYDDVVVSQAEYYTGAVDAFPAEARDIVVPLIDGTCFAASTALVRAVGLLDHEHFGRRGWGAIEDYIIRVRDVGGNAVVTRRSYLQHAGHVTANSTMSSYARYATSEMRRGLRLKHGPDWRHHFPVYPQGRDTLRVRLRDSLRAVEDRLHLSETFIGRRGLGR